MYTIYQLATVNTIDTHVGFYFILFGIVALSWMMCGGIDYLPFERILLILLVSIGGPAAYISWHTGEIITYANTPVICKMVEFWGEGHTEQRTSGKTTNTVQVHNQYVSYKTPDGIVSFPIISGQPWPETVILYKN